QQVFSNVIYVHKELKKYFKLKGCGRRFNHFHLILIVLRRTFHQNLTRMESVAFHFSGQNDLLRTFDVLRFGPIEYNLTFSAVIIIHVELTMVSYHNRIEV